MVPNRDEKYKIGTIIYIRDKDGRKRKKSLRRGNHGSRTEWWKSINNRFQLENIAQENFLMQDSDL